jgi:low affinity Fe/Cu permease
VSDEGRKTSQSADAPGETAGSGVFQRFASLASTQLGTPWAFTAALVVVIVWAALGPVFHFSETWQLVINTGTTIITFLMVFIIQSTQNRDAKAIHLKLDELIRSSEARNVFADLENASEAELDRFQHDFEQLRKRSGNADIAAESRENSGGGAEKKRP